MANKSNNKDTFQTKATEEARKMLDSEKICPIAGIILIGIAIFIILAFLSFLSTGSEDYSEVSDGSPAVENIKNMMGIRGAKISYYLINKCFGFPAFVIPVFMIMAGLKLTKSFRIRLWKWFVYLSLIMLWNSLLFGMIDFEFLDCPFFIRFGGQHGINMFKWMNGQIGTAGVIIFLFISAICYAICLSDETIILLKKLTSLSTYRKKKDKVIIGQQTPEDDERFRDMEEEGEDENDEEEEESEDESSLPENFETEEEAEPEQNPEPAEPIRKPAVTPPDNEPDDDPNVEDEQNIINNQNEEDDANTEVEITDKEPVFDVTAGTSDDAIDPSKPLAPYDPRLDLEFYKFPTLSLLNKMGDNAVTIDQQEQEANKKRITEVLNDFGVEITSIQATVGPTITLYEITLQRGVRISKVASLENDIALSLAALGIRIIAPIPGKGTIGIEVPNKDKKIVSMESIMNTRTFQESKMALPIAFGKTITNEVFMVDLAKAPHMLVAGATGMGKSVGLNAIITSLLYKKHPAELKLVMVDPKKVEFSVYSPIERHFLAKLPDGEDAIITDVTKVVQTLKSLCYEMDMRYDLLKKARVRNIKEYNELFKSRKLNPDNGHRFMPYIVVIIDEFGDLIMTAGKEIELPICRIAQLARAVGIHMIIATQRPTTNIITGTIKANFPARVAFRVAAMMDSRTILDRSGAQQLIGRGDMLYLQGEEPVRVQCAFVDTPEVENICNYIEKQQGYTTAWMLPEVPAEEGGEGGGTGQIDGDIDPMFKEAAQLIVDMQQGSTSLIQRKFSIGYNRAGRIMDQLEKAGIVGPTRGAKPREVLCVDQTDLEMRLSNLNI
jgi:S-DNA-T family DNA segregation ATPase FtsK/SpoIIIE